MSEVLNITAAAVFTAQEHRPLNRHTTIHFDKCGIADPVAALRRYAKIARDWLKTQGAPFAYIWVRESGHGKDEHAHLLMHVPADLIGRFATIGELCRHLRRSLPVIPLLRGGSNIRLRLPSADLSRLVARPFRKLEMRRGNTL